MAIPSYGPYDGDVNLLIQATGTDSNPLTETTISLAGNSNWKRLSNQLQPSGGGGNARVYISSFGVAASPNVQMWSQLLARGTNIEYVDFVFRMKPLSPESFYETETDFGSTVPTDTQSTWKMDADNASNVPTDIISGYALNSYFAGAAYTIDGGAAVAIEHFLWNTTTARWEMTNRAIDRTPTATLLSAGYFGLEGNTNGTYAIGDIYGGICNPFEISLGTNTNVKAST